ncbi:FAD-dependent monooxygenase [Streptomyces sp. NPDC046909]|uniref:FAD-dependent monooxygenase n=1 Tax=Streptomyces sp. NPDC046909 TaxID=3155617 RepID=UPI0033F78344
MRVLVVGGGIAGMATAIGLRRNTAGAVDVDVAELSGEPVGAAITMMNRALDALGELGLYEELASVGTVFQANDLHYFDAAGARLPGSFGAGQKPTAGSPAPSGPIGLALYRPQLAQLLSTTAAQEGANLLPLGLTVAALDSNPSGVEVTFTDGGRASYDVVVGAEGIRSTVRSHLFGDRYQPRFLGDLSLRLMVDSTGLDLQSGFHFSEGAMFVVAHLKNGLSYVFTAFSSDEIVFLDRAQAAARMRANTEHFTNPAMKTLRDRVRPDSDVVCRASQSLWIDEPWYRDRVVVIGDGAHTTTPHLASGGGMALEDGVVLAAELARADTPEEGLDRFYRRRYERVADVVRTTSRLNELRLLGGGAEEAGRLRGRAFARLAEPY